MLTLGHLTAGERPLLRWSCRDDVPENPGRGVDKILRCGPHGPPIGERTTRALLVVPAGHSLMWVRLRAEDAAGVVLCGGDGTDVEDCGPVPVLQPTFPGDTVRVAEALAGAQVAVLSKEIRQVEQYVHLAAEAMAEGEGPDALLEWVSRESGGKVLVVDGHREQTWPEEVKKQSVLLRELVHGRERGPVRGTSQGRYIEVWPVGVGPPHRLLIASNDRPWSGRAKVGLEETAVMVAALLREREVTEREHRLRAAVLAARTSGFQYLMVGDVTSAGRAIEPLAPGLTAAGVVQLAVVEIAPFEQREEVAEEVEEVLQWGRSLTVLCPVDEAQIIVIWDGAQAPVQTVLEPVAEAEPERAVGVSGSGPLEHAARLYGAAAVSVEAARRTAGGVAVHDGRPPLAELLDASARAWARQLLAPLEDGLAPVELRRLLEVCQAAITMGVAGAGRLLGLHRETVDARLEELTYRVGLDSTRLGDRATLDLALRLSNLPPPVPGTTPPAGGVRAVLAQEGAAMWGSGVLSGLTPRLLSAVTAWVQHNLDNQEAARELGISTENLSGWLREAGTITHLPLTKDRPAAVHDLLWALYVTGRVRPTSIAGTETTARAAGAGETAAVPGGEPRTDRLHPARVYDYFLGGRTNFAADRIAAQQAIEAAPDVALMARENRGFLLRAARYIAKEGGVRQFLDLGAGIPTEPNLHQVVQSEDPSAGVVYVDNDPVVHAHAQALLGSTPHGRAEFLLADATDPEAVVEAPEVRNTLDLGEPVALSLVALLPYITDDETADAVLRKWTGLLAPGSYLTLTQLTADRDPDAMRAACEEYRSEAGLRLRARSYQQTAALLHGVDLVPPGLVLVHRWGSDRSEQDLADDDPRVGSYGAVARVRR